MLLMILILSIVSLVFATPSEISKSEDPHYHFQWGLQNKGELFAVKHSATQTRWSSGVFGMDVDIKDLDELLKIKLKKNPVVALLDSDFDSEHPDLDEAFLPDGKDFTQGDEPENKRKSENHEKEIDDEDEEDEEDEDEKKDGHGIHLAGIIAAKSRNGIGVRGVSDRIKILPITIYRKKGHSSSHQFGVRVAQAIQYAIDKNVDVINFSYGIPLFHYGPKTREMMSHVIQRALKKNILLVVASGNEGHTWTGFPCSVKGVVCVGGINGRGEIQKTSNQSGHVNYLAPAEAILSTYPITMGPVAFSEPGYAVLSGTSQAAPHVSAAIALLKGVYPQITADEVMGRLNETSMPRPSQRKDSLSGLIQIKKAIEATAKPSVRPNFKELMDIKVDANGEFHFEFGIKNYWKKAKQTLVQIQPSESGIQFSQNKFSLGELAEGQEKGVKLSGKILHFDLEARFVLRVAISIEGQAFENYTHLLNLTRELSPTQSEVNTIVLSNLSSDQVFSINESGFLRTTLKPILSSHNSEATEFYFTSKKGSGLELTLLMKSKGDSGFLIRSLGLDNRKLIEMVQRMDLNNDGTLDLLIVSSEKPQKKTQSKRMHFLYLDSYLNPLYGQKSEFTLNIYKSFSLDDAKVKFVSLSLQSEGKRMRVPVFMQKGTISKKDTHPNPLVRDKLSLNFLRYDVEPHIYYMNPVDNHFELRVVDHKGFYQNIYKELGFNWSSRITILSPLFDKRYDTASFLISGGHYPQFQFYHLCVSENMNTNVFSVDSYIDLGSSKIGRGFVFGNKVKVEPISTFTWPQAPHLVHFGILGWEDGWEDGRSSDQGSYHLALDAESEIITAALPSLVSRSEQKVHSFFFSETNLIAVSNGQRGTNAYGPENAAVIARYPLYLPGIIDKMELFSRFYIPILSAPRPAFFVNMTLFSERSSYLIEYHSETHRLVAPVKFNFNLPENCVFLDPISLEQRDELPFLCMDKGGLRLSFFPL